MEAVRAGRRDPRRARLRLLPAQQAPGVGGVPPPGHAVRAATGTFRVVTDRPDREIRHPPGTRPRLLVVEHEDDAGLGRLAAPLAGVAAARRPPPLPGRRRAHRRRGQRVRRRASCSAARWGRWTTTSRPGCRPTRQLLAGAVRASAAGARDLPGRASCSPSPAAGGSSRGSRRSRSGWSGSSRPPAALDDVLLGPVIAALATGPGRCSPPRSTTRTPWPSCRRTPSTWPAGEVVRVPGVPGRAGAPGACSTTRRSTPEDFAAWMPARGTARWSDAGLDPRAAAAGRSVARRGGPARRWRTAMPRRSRPTLRTGARPVTRDADGFRAPGHASPGGWRAWASAIPRAPSGCSPTRRWPACSTRCEDVFDDGVLGALGDVPDPDLALLGLVRLLEALRPAPPATDRRRQRPAARGAAQRRPGPRPAARRPRRVRGARRPPRPPPRALGVLRRRGCRDRPRRRTRRPARDLLAAVGADPDGAEPVAGCDADGRSTPCGSPTGGALLAIAARDLTAADPVDAMPAGRRAGRPRRRHPGGRARDRPRRSCAAEAPAAAAGSP